MHKKVTNNLKNLGIRSYIFFANFLSNIYSFWLESTGDLANKRIRYTAVFIVRSSFLTIIDKENTDEIIANCGQVT